MTLKVLDEGDIRLGKETVNCGGNRDMMRPLRPMVRLTPQYAAFCAFETLAINGVGCGSLVFQDELSAMCPYPGLYEFWFAPPIPASDIEHLMCYMIAAWLAVAGVLQGSVNFDPSVPRRTKLCALYCFALCDAVWVVLMVMYTSYFSVYHIVGSAFTIYQRARFWLPGGADALVDE